MIIVIVVVVLVVLSCIGVPICVCLGCKRGANGRRGPAGAELGGRYNENNNRPMLRANRHCLQSQ